MKLFVQAYSYQDNLPSQKELKTLLKKEYKIDTRRKDRFIYLALLGALKLQENTAIDTKSELYITSSLGNIDVVDSVYNTMILNKEIMALFDFINLLGNTTNFYVAKVLGLRGKSLYTISQKNNILNLLTTIKASLAQSGNEAVFGTIDALPKQLELAKRLSGVAKEETLQEEISFFQLSSTSNKHTLATLEFEQKNYTKEEVLAYENLLISNENSGGFGSLIPKEITKCIKEKKNTTIAFSNEGYYKIITIKGKR